MLTFHPLIGLKPFTWISTSLIFFLQPPLTISLYFKNYLINPLVLSFTCFWLSLLSSHTHTSQTFSQIYSLHISWLPFQHRRYQCLILDTQQIILSRHVTFVESVFPFGSMTPNSTMPYEFLDIIDDSNSLFQLFHQTPVTSTSIP